MAKRRNRHGEGSVAEVRPGVWRVWISLGRDPVTGRRRRITQTVTAETREDAIRALERLRAKAERGRVAAPSSRMTVRELMEEWLQACATSGVSDSTLWTYQRRTKQVVKRLGTVRVRDLTRPFLQQWIADLYREGYSHRSVAWLRSALNGALNLAVDRGLIPYNPLTGLRARTAQLPRPEIPSEDEVREFLEMARKSSWYLPIRIMVATGMRRGEVLGLRWRDLDWDQRTITVAGAVVYARTREGTKIWWQSPKTDAGRRVIYVDDDETWRLLREQQATVAEWRKRAGDAWEDHDLVFPNRHSGRPRNPNVLSHAVYDLTRGTSLEGRLWVHMLRHVHASTLLALGWPVSEVSRRLGHRSPAITMQVYAHAVPGQQERLARELGTMPPGLRDANK